MRGASQVRANFAVDDQGILAQLACLAALLRVEDGELYDKLEQVSSLTDRDAVDLLAAPH
jgi:hypothetical protein